jgi:hypothetical protein
VQPWQAQKYGVGRVRVPRTSEDPDFRTLLEVLRAAVEAKLPQPEQAAAGNVQPLRAHPMRGAA